MSPKAQTFFKRLFSTVILLAVLGGAVAWNSAYGYAALICLFCNMTTIEWYRMLRERRAECCRWLVLLGGLVYPWLLAWVRWVRCADNELAFSLPSSWEMPLIALVGYALVAFGVQLWRMDYRGLPAQRALAGLGITLLAFVYPVWMFAFSLLMGLWADPTPLLALILLTKLSDTWAYVCGVLLGRRFISRPFSPVVSPKKSWEGIIGSFILTMVSALLMGVLLHHYEILLVTPVIFVFAVAGDLSGSLIKRGLEVKDSGSLLPGIGGIFDLLDSPAFTVALVMLVGLLI